MTPALQSHNYTTLYIAWQIVFMQMPATRYLSSERQFTYTPEDFQWPSLQNCDGANKHELSKVTRKSCHIVLSVSWKCVHLRSSLINIFINCSLKVFSCKVLINGDGASVPSKHNTAAVIISCSLEINWWWCSLLLKNPREALSLV